jgi:hypothetical protein
MRFAAIYAAAIMLLLFFGSLAAVSAQDRHEWPGYREGLPPLVIEAVPGGDHGAVATVTITNELVIGWDVPSSATLRAGEHQITVEIRQANGHDPDTFAIVAPPGYVAIPGQVILLESETAVILIVPGLSS